MLTGKDYCDYETCVALWSMGLIPHPYDNTDTDKVMAIISLYEAQKWLREEKKIHVEVYFSELCNKQPCFEWVIVREWDYSISNLLSSKGKYFSSEEALSEGIKEAVKILKENETILR